MGRSTLWSCVYLFQRETMLWFQTKLLYVHNCRFWLNGWFWMRNNTAHLCLLDFQNVEFRKSIDLFWNTLRQNWTSSHEIQHKFTRSISLLMLLVFSSFFNFLLHFIIILFNSSSKNLSKWIRFLDHQNNNKFCKITCTIF